MSSEIGQAICPIHVAPGEGQAIWAMSSLFEIKLDAADSGGSLTVMEVACILGISRSGGHALPQQCGQRSAISGRSGMM